MLLQEYRGLDAPSLDTTVRIYAGEQVAIRTTGYGRDVIRVLSCLTSDDIDLLRADLQRWQDGVSIQDAFSGVPAFKKVISDPYFGLSEKTIMTHQTTTLPVPLQQLIYLEDNPMDN